MPLNEAASLRRGGLTTQQKREALAAIYGLNPKDYSVTPQLTAQEIERMRQIVSAADAKSGGIKEFDLANPPRPPYTHQEFPRLMYNHSTGKSQSAQSHEDVVLAEAKGWSKNPLPPDDSAPAEIELDAEAAAEVAELDARARIKKVR